MAIPRGVVTLRRALSALEGVVPGVAYLSPMSASIPAFASLANGQEDPHRQGGECFVAQIPLPTGNGR